MKDTDAHLSDDRLLRHLDGELSRQEARSAGAHLDGCWRCRARRQELERAIEGFIGVHQESLDSRLPPADGPRAKLRASVAQLAAAGPARRGLSGLFWAAGAAVCGIAAAVWLAAGLWTPAPGGHFAPQLSVPDSRLTPGAAVLLSPRAVCEQANVKNRMVPVSLQRRVFAEYGMAGADPGAYEVDYLITPALGGADDIHNLWPQPHSTVWSAEVKDALEDHLRDLVCSGRLDLAQAQREIAEDWVGAYRKYFHTDQPLQQHRRPRF
jgi:hypothetical protein